MFGNFLKNKNVFQYFNVRVTKRITPTCRVSDHSMSNVVGVVLNIQEKYGQFKAKYTWLRHWKSCYIFCSLMIPIIYVPLQVFLTVHSKMGSILFYETMHKSYFFKIKTQKLISIRIIFNILVTFIRNHVICY